MKESIEALNNGALHLIEKGEYEAAIECLKRAITLEPENHLLWFNLGVTYRDFGKLEEATETLRKAYELCDEEDEDYIEVADTLAITLMNQGDIDSALSVCAEILSKNEMNPRIWNTFGVLYFNKSELELAAEAFEHAITLNPYYYDALYNLRDTYEEMGNEEGMKSCIEQMKLIKKSEGN